MDVMNEVLIENEPGKEGEDDYSLMLELHTALRAMQERATGLIGRVADEIVLGGNYTQIILVAALYTCML